MKKLIRITLLLMSLIALPACSFGSAETSTPTPIPPSATLPPTITPTPTYTPTPSATPTITPTYTPNPTEIVENYMSMLGSYLATANDVEVVGMNIEAGTLQMNVQSRGSSRSFLQLTAWQIIQDLAQLLQSLGPNTELLLDIIGTDEYAVDLIVLSEDGSVGYRSETNRDTFIAIQQRSISYQHWELLANGHFEEF
jgi:ABC-type glycerol-3-phosphate transport system substrate-binding protein